MPKYLYLSIFIIILFVSTACQPATGTVNQNEPSGSIEDVRVITTQPTESRVKTETFPLPNCGGTGEIRQTLGSTASIAQSVTLSGKATVKGGGEADIPEVAKLKLEIEIEAAYQKTYEAANSRLDTINMPAAAGTHVIYEIGWYEQTFNSIVQYSLSGQVYEAPYTYKLQVPKIDNSSQVVCPTGTQENAVVTNTTNYDDFNNSLYDNSINVDLWETLKDSNCDISQEDGAAVFRLKALSAERTLCYLGIPNDVKLDKLGNIEASLLAENDASGDYSLGIFEFKTVGSRPDTVWIAQCGIIQTPNENKTEMFFYVNSSFPEGEPELYQTIAMTTGEWNKMRIETEPGTGTISCYANDRLLGSYTPSNLDVLNQQVFNRQFVGFWSPQSAGTFRLDDVVVQP